MESTERCTHCNETVSPEWTTCASCGASLTHPGATYGVSPRAPGLEPEVRDMARAIYHQGLRRWPSAVVVLTMGVSIVWSFGVSVAKGNPALVVGGILVAALGVGLAYLAGQEEADLPRMAAVWMAVLAYLGTAAGCLLAMTGTENGTGFPGYLFGAGMILLFAALPFGVLTMLWTAFVYRSEDHEDPINHEESRVVVRRGLELGAASGAGILVAMGLLLVLFGGDHPAWTDGARVATAFAVVLVTTAFTVRGAYLHAPGSPERRGLLMLWIGAIALALFAALDSNPATSLSGTPPGYGTDLSGFGYWFLPAAALGLVAALAGTKFRRPRHGKSPIAPAHGQMQSP